MSQLTPCPSCSRHLRRTETACPFCGERVAETMATARDRALPVGRLSRTALLAFAAAAVGTAACSGDTTDGTGRGKIDGDASASGGASANGTGGMMVVPLYGAAMFSGGTTGAGGNAAAGGSPSAGGTVAALYGLPPTTGGTSAEDAGADAEPPGSGGGFAALYGGPPRTLYGAPPAPSK